MSSRRRLARATALVIATVGVAGLSGCGIDADGSPRDISGERQRELLEDNPSAPEGATTEGDRIVYLVRESSGGEPSVIRAVHRDVDATAAAIMRSLLEGPTVTEQGARLSTAIPPGTELLGVQFVDTGVLAVDFSEEILSATGDALVDAVAQIVLTMTQVDRVEKVKLLVEGQDQQWPRGDGVVVSTPLTAYDFPGRVATTQPDYPPIPSPQAG
jgi:spore germination protein GerM